MRMKSDAGIDVRPYRDEDEEDVLRLMSAALGPGPVGERIPEFFRWKHVANPFGRSFMLVAEAEGRIVGFRAFMRWLFSTEGRQVSAVRAVDTATSPDHQRRGIFRTLTLDSLDALRGEGDLVFNTPNAVSLRGYLSMGWKRIGRIPMSVRVRRPLRFASALPSLRSAGEAGPGPSIDAPTAAEALRDDVEGLLRVARLPGRRLQTMRNVDYLRWRYGAPPRLGYRVIREDRGGSLRGLAVFRVRARGRAWESSVAEVIVPAGDWRTARGLLRSVADAASVDHLTGHFPADSAPARAARRFGFVRVPAGPMFVVNTLSPPLDPDPTDLRSWALSLGDLEVF